MALKPKTSVLQIRLDDDLLSEFRRLCDYRGETVSAVLRRSISNHNEHWQERERKDAKVALARGK
ncbi:ribbon-helix-helix protein, CopG family [Herminiimonas arsenitoxidans]|uniref:ribbon-helix-helix protein, CopG family n=1 Tax=Herminiimonas arsenitoxidans TaxID=1809410 RepID=UPI0009FA54F1